MDEGRFDSLTRFVGDVTSRRAALRGLAGLSLGAALGTALRDEADAADEAGKRKGKKGKKGKGKGKNCGKNKKKCGNKCIRKDQCCKNGDCSGNQICQKNKCACRNGQKLCNGRCIANGTPCFQQVTEGNEQGWIFAGEDGFSSDPAFTTIVEPPVSPPAPGAGSVKLAPADANSQAVLRTMKYKGTKIGNINRLGYSILVPGGAGDNAPTMQLAIVGDFNNAATQPAEFTGFASLVYIPDSVNEWTDHEPTKSGKWRATRDIVDSNDQCVVKCSVGNCPPAAAMPACASGEVERDWADIKAGIPDAVLNGDDEEKEGSFSIRRGRDNTDVGYVTNVVFNNDGYYFDVE